MPAYYTGNSIGAFILRLQTKRPAAAPGRPKQGQPPRGAGRTQSADRGGIGLAPGRPKQGPSPRGAATRVAAERGGKQSRAGGEAVLDLYRAMLQCFDESALFQVLHHAADHFARGANHLGDILAGNLFADQQLPLQVRHS